LLKGPYEYPKVVRISCHQSGRLFEVLSHPVLGIQPSTYGLIQFGEEASLGTVEHT
jgi:hypothetical protein